MAYKDLREFINVLEERNLLVRIRHQVSCNLEITEIADRMVKKDGPALLFENVKGHNFPVIVNAFASYDRMKLALEVRDINDIAKRITDLLTMEAPDTIWQKVLMLPKLHELSQFIPRHVKTGPCKDVIVKGDDVDVLKFPILKCWPLDAGQFITLPMVFTKDMETQRMNTGMYRMQVYDGKTCGMHWHMHKDGARQYKRYEEANQRMEVAVVIGADPASMYSATCPLPAGIDEMLFAGFLRKEPVELIKCESVDIDVPAQAEIVLEGYVDPYERRIEGPFGDHTGFYSPEDEYPVFHVTCITHRRDAIYPTTIVGKPPMEDCFFGKATERIFLPLLKLQLPEIVDMNLPLEGVFHNCVIVSIKKEYVGQAKRVMHAIWGMGQMMFTKVIIVVDDNVNVHNLSEVAWKVLNYIDPRRDVSFVDGPLDVLNHASNIAEYGSKMGIDATTKGQAEGMTRPWPTLITMNDEIKRLVDEQWGTYGLE